MKGFRDETGLADALDLALAKRGAAPPVLDREVADIVDFARTLEEAASQVRASDEFRGRARQRLLMRTARSAQQQSSLRHSVADRARVWAARIMAGLGALTIAGAAAASASASALPGDAFYPVKQVAEAAALQLAPTDTARQDVLLHQADARLEETARLLQQGRDMDAAASAARYEETLSEIPASSGSGGNQPELSTNLARLTELLQMAPASARPGLERALTATERHAKPAAQSDMVEPSAARTPASRDSQRPPQLPGTESATVRPSVPANAANAEAHAAPATPDRTDHANPVESTQVSVEPDLAAGDDRGTSTPPDIEKNHPAPGADSQAATSSERTAPHGNAPPAIAPPERSAPERSGAPKPGPTMHGRP